MSEYNRTSLPRDAKPSAEYIYKTETGALHSKVSRYDLGDGEKTFRQWHWDEHDKPEGEWVIGKADGPRIPYHLDRLNAARKSEDLHIGEGEQAADTLTGLGFLATTNPGGAENWDPALNQHLKGRHRIFIHADNDRPGRDFARQVARNLEPLAIKVHIVSYPDTKEKGDVTDWIKAGHTKEELIARYEAAPVFKSAPILPGGINARELFAKEFEPIKYIVPGLVVEGLTLFAGTPKIGKSWLWLQVGLAVAAGGITFGNRQCEQGDVLYLALEDNQRRLNARIKKLWDMATLPVPDRLTLYTEWPRQDQSGVDRIREWITEHPDARLVIVDVLAMFRPSLRDKNQGNYDADFHALKSLQALALEKSIGIIVIHHTRKSNGSGGDYGDEVSGTLGLNGGADTFLVLKRESGAVRLVGRGRDIEEFDYALKFDGLTCQWSILGDASEVLRSAERAQILDVLKKASDALGPKDIAAQCNKSEAAINTILFRMLQDGEVVKEGRGKYLHPDRQSSAKM